MYTKRNILKDIANIANRNDKQHGASYVLIMNIHTQLANFVIDRRQHWILFRSILHIQHETMSLFSSVILLFRLPSRRHEKIDNARFSTAHRMLILFYSIARRR